MLKDDVAAPATAQGRLLGIRGHDEAKDHIVRLWTSIRGSGQLSRVRLSEEYEKGTWIGLQPGDVFSD